MDSIKYDEFGLSENNTNSGKIFLQKVMQSRMVYLLYYLLLVFLLLLILLVTGLKFSQLSQEIADVHLYLESLNKAVMTALDTPSFSSSDQGTIHKIYEEIEDPVRGTCNMDWWSYQGSCYLTSKRRLNWNAAEQKCIDLSAHLLVLNSQDELDYISKLVQENEHYWIGLVERTAEGDWTWVDGTDYKSTPNFWDRGQPDNWDVRVNGEDCGELHPGPRSRRKLWNDADCTLPFLYICEGKGQ